jgi:two-component system response regulator QseB
VTLTREKSVGEIVHTIAMRLLLVEDDSMIGAAAQQGLRHEGHGVDWVRDGREAELAAANGVYDLVLLDLGLPRKGGLALLREWRARGNDTPVLIITARDAVSDRVAGLDAGADDYLVKPFDLDELSARVRAVLRRRSGRADSVVKVGPLELDVTARRAKWNGAEVALSAREYALVEALADRPGAYMSRAQLEERLYGWGEEVSSNAVEVHIHALRRKLAPGFIRNTRGLGYTLAVGEP